MLPLLVLILPFLSSFGYDQGVMGGVNTSPDYVTTMGIGYATYAAFTTYFRELV